MSDAAQFRPGASSRIDPQLWEARARSVVEDFIADGLEPNDAAEALREMKLVDDADVVWIHDGSAWRNWAPPGTAPSAPTGPLRLQPFTMVLVEAPDEPPEVAEPYAPTDLVPPGGLPAWNEADPEAQPVAMLEADLDVMLVDIHDDGWAEVRCSNDWSAWVDGRLLIPLE